MPEIKWHQRINNILLGPLERPLLLWLAERMPSWVMPDHLTALGMFGSLIILAGYILSNLHPAYLWLASLGFVTNWFGDSLDGTLARYRNIQRPRYGFFVDHTLDSLSETMIFIGLGLTPYFDFRVACLALIAYLLVSILVYVRTAVDGIFKISFGGFGPTEIRAIAILLNTGLFFNGNIYVNLPFGRFSVYDLVGILIAVILFLIFLSSTYLQSRELAKLKE
jgi:phosphatidylglycerophosphate synthase